MENCVMKCMCIMHYIQNSASDRYYELSDCLISLIVYVTLMIYAWSVLTIFCVFFLGFSSLALDSTHTRLFASCMDNFIYQFDCASLSSAPGSPSFCTAAPCVVSMALPDSSIKLYSTHNTDSRWSSGMLLFNTLAAGDIYRHLSEWTLDMRGASVVVPHTPESIEKPL